MIAIRMICVFCAGLLSVALFFTTFENKPRLSRFCLFLSLISAISAAILVLGAF